MACEKCWAESQRTGVPYADVISSKPPDQVCTPEEQCGVGTTEMHTIYAGRNQCECGAKWREQVQP